VKNCLSRADRKGRSVNSLQGTHVRNGEAAYLVDLFSERPDSRARRDGINVGVPSAVIQTNPSLVHPVVLPHQTAVDEWHVRDVKHQPMNGGTATRFDVAIEDPDETTAVVFHSKRPPQHWRDKLLGRHA